jgi:hypothetical protein
MIGNYEEKRGKFHKKKKNPHNQEQQQANMYFDS